MSTTLEPSAVGRAARMLEQPTVAGAEEISRIRASIDLGNATAVLEFGAATQTKLVTFADAVLAQVRSADSGAIGRELHALLDR